MTQIDQSLPAVLRRRVRTFRNSYRDVIQDWDWADKFMVSILAAADELEVRRRCADPEGAEDVAVQAIQEARALRGLLVDIHGALPNYERVLADRIKAVLASTPEAGQGRRILGVEVGDGDTKENILAKLGEQLDNYFEASEADQAALEPFLVHCEECSQCQDAAFMDGEGLCDTGQRLVEGQHADGHKDAGEA